MIAARIREGGASPQPEIEQGKGQTDGKDQSAARHTQKKAGIQPPRERGAAAGKQQGQRKMLAGQSERYAPAALVNRSSVTESSA